MYMGDCAVPMDGLGKKRSIKLTLIDLAEQYNSGKLGLRIIGNGRMEDEYSYLVDQPLSLQEAMGVVVLTHITAMLGRHVLVRFLDEHF